ncbi:MAG: SBBP repeat-containing protein, partial [Candidatus Binatia bacterium]
MRTADPEPAAGEEELTSRASYFLGDDPSLWQAGVASYARVRYSDVYPGIDLVYYGNQRRLEFDFVVDAGADAREIALQIEGADRVERAASGALRLVIGETSVELEAPIVYQLTAGGEREPVAGGYVVEKGVDGGAHADVIRFELAAHDRSRELVIDPILSYSSYLGGTGADQGLAIASDAAGSVYIAGKTISTDFPERNACAACGSNSTVPLEDDVFVAKLDPQLAGDASLVWATYLGGNDNDTGLAIAVDGDGAVYVTGKAESTNFPDTPNAFRNSLKGGNEEYNAFVSKLSADGTQLLYSTYLGGENTEGKGIAVLDGGLAVVVGGTTSLVDIPTNGGFQTTPSGTVSGSAGDLDGFVTVFNAGGTGVIASSYLGRVGGDEVTDVVIGSGDTAYIVGRTMATDFPTTAGAYRTAKDPVNNFTNNGFVARIDVDMSGGSMSLGYSSYLPGGEIVARGVDLDTSGNIHVAGSIQFGSTFETLNAVQAVGQGGMDGFALKLNAAGSALMYSTYLGGANTDTAHDVAVDASGNAHIVGTTRSTDFPTERPLQASLAGANDVFISKLSAAGSTLLYSTYLGGAVDDQGRGVATGAEGVTYITGFSTSTGFPTANAFQAAAPGSIDAIVARIFDTVGIACTTNPQCDDGDA